MSTIRIYRVDFDPSDNVRVEDLENYLYSLTSIDFNMQYQKMSLDMTVKLAVPQEYQQIAIGNYAAIEQDGKTYYYFIMNANWVSKNCVQLVLSIDSINTFWNDIVFNETTHITRMHKNRLAGELSGNNILLNRIVDNYKEGITPYLMRKTKSTLYNTTDIDLRDTTWYLIYRTLYEPKVDVISNPIVLSCVNKKEIKFPSSSISTKVITSAHLNPSYWYQCLNTYETNCVFKLIDGGYPGTYEVGSYSPADNTTCYQIWFRVSPNDSSLIQIQFKYYGSNNSEDGRGKYLPLSTPSFILNTYVSQIEFLDCNKVYIHINEPNLWPVNSEGGTGTFTINAGSENIIKSINNIDRTDSKLIKIIELPYPPFNFNDTVPEGWELKNGELVYNQLLDTELECDLRNSNLPNRIVVSKADVLAFKNKDIKYETKLFNSDLYARKFTYGDSVWEFKQENIDKNTQATSNTLTVGIKFKASRDISSGNAFKFTIDKYKYDEDHGEYLVSNRDNQYPIYTSEYINYLNYGKVYDQKANTIANVSSIGGFAATTGSAIAMMALGAATNTGRVIGLVTSIVAGAVSLGTSIANQVNAQNQKEAQLRNQSVNVNGSTDRDIFNYITKNKLELITYTPTDEMRNRLFKLFDITGYGTDEYGIPNLNTRYWRNYIQCEAIFDIKDAYLDYKQDIIQRFANGVTVLHNHNNEYDFEFNKENWENDIVELARS